MKQFLCLPGKEIWMMVISDDPNIRPLLRPQVKFVGNINGVSGPACFALLKLIEVRFANRHGRVRYNCSFNAVLTISLSSSVFLRIIFT